MEFDHPIENFIMPWKFRVIYVWAQVVEWLLAPMG
jgi:hypothetical protein